MSFRTPYSAVPVLLVTVMVSLAQADIRTIDGSGNNQQHPEWGAVGAKLERFAPPLYGDGISTMAEDGRPNPRAVSNILSEQSVTMPSGDGLSDMVWVWGQFLDHDISLTPEAKTEFAPVMTDDGDMLAPMIPMMRSKYDPETGTSTANPRQQTNTITAFIDGSVIYGSDEAKAMELRTKEGGQLRIADDGMLPKNLPGVSMANPVGLPPEALHSAGDVRANENPALLAMHTLWVREHNFQSQQLSAQHPEWTDEEIYQHARRIVAGEIQAITYQEFLPALMGDVAPSLNGASYNPSLNPGILNEFSAALYRLGHSMIPTHLARVGADRTMMSDEPLIVLRDCFFNPECLDSPDSLDALLRGLMVKPMQEIDTRVVDDMRNFLFGDPGSGGLDLISLNIQRGRDHGAADYNTVRAALGLQEVGSFGEITSDPALIGSLEALYETTDKMDLWVGAVMEDHIEGGSVGETIAAAMREQFIRLRDGDRFFFLFEDAFTLGERAAINRTRLADIIARNTSISDVPVDVFHANPSMVTDSDRDGATDLAEAMAGTDPLDARSAFRLTRATRSGNAIVLEWNSVQGKLYSVEYSPALGETWKTLSSMEAATDTASTTFSDTDPARISNADGYYRVSIRR